jgi:hypothetical protein
MREATLQEFNSAVQRAKWPAPEYSFGKRSQTTRYSDCGVEVAEKTSSLIRGKVVSVVYLVNPKYLGE